LVSDPSENTRLYSDGPTRVEHAYSAKDQAWILKAWRRRPNAEEAVFAQIERDAQYFRCWREQAEAEPLSASRQERYWQRIAPKVAAAASALAEALNDSCRYPDLIAAAHDVARANGLVPPDPPGVSLGLGVIWPAETRLEQAHGGLELLRQVIERASERAASRKGPAGRQADEALHWFVRALDKVYRHTALEPERPTNNDEGEKFGELLDFLDACLVPLGVERSVGALYSLWWDAVIEDVFNPWGPSLFGPRRRHSSSKRRDDIKAGEEPVKAAPRKRKRQVTVHWVAQGQQRHSAPMTEVEAQKFVERLRADKVEAPTIRDVADTRR
jgi:hypothetical protein